MAAQKVRVGDEMGTIRIEADRNNDLTDVYAWLTRHRGQVVGLSDDHSLSLGVPISGARAVIVAAVLDNGVGGVIRALANPFDSRRVHFVFEIRSMGGLGREDVRALGEDVIDSLAQQVAGGPLVARVA